MDEDSAHDLDDGFAMQSSTGSLGFQYQKELAHNKLLPYAEELENESQLLLSDIKGNLGQAVMLRELHPGCNIWTTRLCRYIKIYGLKFSKEDHILFIKLMYELITIPNLEPFLIKKFGSTLILLLKKRDLLSVDELELPWKPLYELAHRVRTGAERTLGIYRYFLSLENTLNTLVHFAKIYFPVSATREILDELRPMLCPLDGNTMCKTVECLEWFLPLHVAPRYHSLAHQLWFEEFMTLWEVCHNAPQWENDMTWLMAKLACANIGYINWEPYLPLMFTRFLRSLNLPVSYKQMQNSRHHKIETSPIAVWIIAVLGPRSNAQSYLEKFLKTIETYFHPANFGRWLGRLRELLRKLPSNFISRLHKERFYKHSLDTPIPDDYKLTDENVDAFVKCMMPVAMTAMFNKLAVTDACHALQALATMRPNLVIPNVLERMYSTLDSLTEPHKLTSAMICMVAVARPMVQGARNANKGYTYPDGPMHVLPLLFSSLPGIDPNDTVKCFITFRLISVYATLIPIVDSSRSSAEMDEEERMLCETTSRFEDFILQFLDRVFALIDSSSLEFERLESRAGDDKSKLESMAETALGGVFLTLLIQTSSTIFDCALHKLRTFITERILETKVAGQLVAVVCRIFSRVNGQATLRALVPILSQTILDVMGENEDIVKEENLDNRLLYAMLLLSAVVDTQGNNLLPHIGVLTKVLDHVLHLKPREGSKIACRLLNRILNSLSTVTPCKYRSLERDYNDPEYPYIKNWGQALHIDSVVIDWYVPGEEEIAVAQKIFSKYLPPEVEKLEKYCTDWNTLTREELLISLNIVSSIMSGCEPLLPVWDEPPLKLADSCLEWTPFTFTVGIKGAVVMPDGSNVRRSMTKVFSKLQKVMLENSEDDTKSLFVLVKIWNSILWNVVRSRESHESRRKSFQIGKSVLEDKLRGHKEHMGPLILERADIQHETRIQFQSNVLTETHKMIMLELFQLATGRYADVRSIAQCSLCSALQQFPSAHSIILPSLLEVLGKDTDEHHDAYKGVLYILLGRQQDPIVAKRDWQFLKSLWPALVLSQPSEKLSVIKLKENLVEAVNRLFPTTTISLEIPDGCVKAASALWESSPRPALPQPKEDEILKGVDKLRNISEANLEAYKGLLDDLLQAILKQNLHWRHRTMAMNFIRSLVHPDQEYPPNIVRYFVGALIHDSLEERKIAIQVVIFMLKQQKRKHPKVKIDVSSFCKNNKEEKEEFTPGARMDNSWLQYNYETRPLTAEQWDEPRFVHQPYIGYYAWPKELEVYAPSAEQPTLDPTVREFSPAEKEIELFINDKDNIEKLVKYFSLEEKKGKDKFNGHRFFLFKGIFRNHGINALKHFIPHLQRLVADKQESSQRCAAEITAGVIRGAKHWPFQMTCEMWDSILPIIRTALSNLTVETMVDWGVCFATAQERRDPNRYHWFLECLMEEPKSRESETSFIECGRLYALQGALIQQSWRVCELLQRLLTRLENRLLTNPLQNVRERLGSLLGTIFDADLRFPQVSPGQLTPRVQNLIDKLIPKLKKLADDYTVIVVTKEEEKKEELNLSTQMSNVSLEEFKNDEQEMAVRLLKTICKWIVGSVSRSQYGALPGFYELFPIVCQLQNCDTDEELTKTCSSTLAVLAQALTLPRDMSVALKAVEEMSRNPSWWARSTCLEFLQVLVFHNMGIVLSNQSWVDNAKTIVLYLLEDPRVEVREKAGQVLGGLLHCGFIPDQETLLETVKTKARTRLHKKRMGGSTSGGAGSSGGGIDSEKCAKAKANIDALRVRHAGVLGLCAFIKAHPYDVPEYVPPIFEHLGLHLNDPEPIPTTIRKTLGDFKRTHYDGWSGLNGHAEQFTEQQLSVLQDLTVPPSYYA